MADYIRPTPRNPLLGLIADAMMGGIDWMQDPRRTQQMQLLGGLISDTGIPQTVDRIASGEPLTKGTGFATRMKPETAAAVMTLAPEAVPIGRAAMRAVRATEGLPVGGAIVYHGSPYRFNRFDPTKIGSGEGAQAYGYGHYVAESPGVARSYQEALSGYSADGKRLPSNIGTIVSNFGGDVDAAIADRQRQLTNWLATNPDKKNFVVKDLQDEIKKLQTLKGKSLESTGSLYTIDLPDPAIARMLDWDKKIKEQPIEIQQAISPLIESAAKAYPYIRESESMTGAGLVGAYRGYRGGNAAATSEALRQQGIPGIRYLDQGSRGAGQGTSNFVVFPGEEDLLRILSVNGGLLTP